jgi:hypothetical protein
MEGVVSANLHEPAKPPTAKEAMAELAKAQAERASAEMHQKAKQDAEMKALIEQWTLPSGVSDEEALKRVKMIVQRAVKSGLAEVEITRFPNALCTDRGRAINQQESGWQSTLTGRPKEMYEFWERELKPLGYKLRVQIVDFSGGVPGDIGLTLRWG